MVPRDIVKIAFQMKQTEQVPFCLDISEKQEEMLTDYYGNEGWKEKIPQYIYKIIAVDNFMSLRGLEQLENGLEKDAFGCIWKRESIDDLIDHPLKSASIKNYTLPDLDDYYADFVTPMVHNELRDSKNSFRIGLHVFGLFERAWSLRGFENLLIDFYDNPGFVDELLDMICDWILESIDHLLSFPIDAVMLTDDYADQRGMIFGLDLFRRYFKPRWKRIFQKIRDAGVYSILHVCGNAEPALTDLIECGLTCLESLQSEAMDVYQVKEKYGNQLRLWGGLGVQQLLPFGNPESIRQEVKRLKKELGHDGGYVLNTSKEFHEIIPVENIAAYLEEASEKVNFK